MGAATYGEGYAYGLALNNRYRYYHNFQRRIDRDKNVSGNSGNYIALQSKYSFGDDSDLELSKTLLTELHWGIQRPLGKRFIFDLHIGLGYLSDFDFDDGSLSPTFGLRFGYKIF